MDTATANERRMSSRIVTTKYGTLRGYVVTLPNRSLQPVEVFMGIPYANPPMGKYRFMPPVSAAHWTGTKMATQPGPVCPQKFPDYVNNRTLALTKVTEGRYNILKRIASKIQNQSEDCLYLNIFTPAINCK
ncbi:neuroligin-4: Y-linked-like protein [Dinothrombium tinctorium]|uniref:Neuroligin-4: Y-linked-like protein n=1 Tax=Dinothrombium tinctorium TaxID=1965070 RepID=A0A3S3QY22_9ACAR|nr:neuroligin-4: Y-linked-like protein [Dinothrombium tinctorium]